jgi:hypothetical protein
MVGYLLRRWNVDCSEDGTLSDPEYQLYLKNIESLSDIDESGAGNLAIAPGYKNERSLHE